MSRSSVAPHAQQTRGDKRLQQRRAGAAKGTGGSPHPGLRPAPPPRVPALPPTDTGTHLVAIGTLVALAIGLYLPTLNGPFVYDDPNAVSQSTLIRHLWPLTLFVTLSNRPLTDFSLAINYAMGGLDPWPYHLTNMLLHACNGVLLYVIAWATLASPALAHRYGAARALIAWAAAALFVVHPLATESVGYVSSRSEVLAAFWILLALGSYIVATLPAARPRMRRTATWVMVGAGFAGLASKESAATIPLVLLLYDWLFVACGEWEQTRPRRRLLALSCLPIVVGGALLLQRAYFSPSPMGDYGATAGLTFNRFTRGQYLMTQFGVILYYLRLVVLPVGQTFDYDWALARTPFSPDVLLPLAVLVALIVVAVRVARTQPLVTFAIGWTLILLAPTSSIVPIADLAVERRMYLPLAGLMLLAAVGLWELVQRLPDAWKVPSWPYVAIVAAPLLALGALTYQRALLWGDPIALHEDGVARAPGNPRVRLNLGVTYLNLGQQEKAYATLAEAKRLYDRQESLQAFPRIGAFIEYNLGAVLFARQQYDAAEQRLKRSIELGGQYLALRPMAFMLLSRIAAVRNDWKGAAADMQEALKYQDNPDWRVDLAEMLRRSGNVPGARFTLKQVLQSQPDNQRAAALLKSIDAAKAAPPP